MKTQLIKIQNFRTIKNLLELHSSAFEGKPKAIVFRDGFFERTETLHQLINGLVSPVSSIYKARKEGRAQLHQKLQLITDFGIMYAKNTGNSSLFNTFTHYNRRLRSISIGKMLQVANDEMNLLNQYQSDAEALGLPDNIVQDLQLLINEFQTVYDQTQLQLGLRRKNRKLIEKHIVECNEILRYEMDKFVRFNAADWPELADGYQYLRRRKPSVKRKTVVDFSDIIGTVSDSASGQLLAGATVRLIEKAWSITTDANGDFLFDDLKADRYTLSCQASGYALPEPASIILGKNDSIVWNFQLVRL
jgi:hypothetical protein